MPSAPTAQIQRRPAGDLAQGDSLANLLAREDVRRQIALALPSHMTPERLLRIALTEARRAPKLLDCNSTSFLAAVFQCAQLGLEPGGSLGHAYLVPYGREVQFQIGYRGMIDLARRSGQIESLSAHAVYEGDRFECELGLAESLIHVPDWNNPNRTDQSRLQFVYAVAHLKDGGRQFEVMSRAEVDAIKKRSRSGSSGPWQTDYGAMALKTVVRRLFKWLPVSIELSRAVSLDEAAEGGKAQESDLDVVLATVTTEHTTTGREEPTSVANTLPSSVTVSDAQIGSLSNAVSMRLSESGAVAFLGALGVHDLQELPAERFDEAMRVLGDPAKVRALNEEGED